MSNRKDITELKGGLNKKPIFIVCKMKWIAKKSWKMTLKCSNCTGKERLQKGLKTWVK